MKNIFKTLFFISFLFISCNDDNEQLNIIEYPYLQQVGYSANDILSSNSYTNILVEVMYVEGFKPTNETITNFKNFIQERTYKTTVTFEFKLIPTPIETTHTINEIKQIEDENRTIFTEGTQFAISALFLNGVSDKDTEESVVMGTAYRNSSFVIFEETIQTFSDSHLEPSTTSLETSIILHEFCHLLGLVNFGTDMVENHEDTDNKAHCVNEDCLMYYQIEAGSRTGGFISGSEIPQLDAFCIQDLQANGGK